ncbi:MAG: hypothetical protein KC684_02500 [Candidatus Omnitrophica bacterium]|nr:hypothetical protein [Candidatus Omnitrophota bacterium]
MSIKKSLSIALIITHLMTYIFPVHLFADELSDFSLFAQEKIELGGQARVETGLIGVNSEDTTTTTQPAFKMGLYARTEPGVNVKATGIKLLSNAVIEGDIYYRDFLNLGLSAVVNGQQNQTSDFPLVQIPAADVCSPNPANNVLIQLNGFQQLSPGAYGDIDLWSNAEIVFEGGRYDIKSLQTGPSTKIYFNAPTVLCISEDFSTGPSAIFGPHPNHPELSSDDIQINIQNSDPSQVGLNNDFKANIFAPNSDLDIFPQTQAIGNFLANSIEIGSQAVINAGSGIVPPINDQTPPNIFNLKPDHQSFINNQYPQISGKFSDSESGIDPDTFIIQVDGEDMSIEATVTEETFLLNVTEELDEGLHNVYVMIKDEAGNMSEEQFEFTIDATPPNISGTITPGPNAMGWHNADVTIQFTCDDELSGIMMCPEEIILTEEGAEQVVEVMAQDNAGNITLYTNTVNIDKTAPVINMFIPENFETVNTARPDIKVVYQDALSGIDAQEVVLKLNDADVSNMAVIDEMKAEYTPEEDLAETTFTTEATVYDKAGNSITQSVIFIVDTTTPNRRPYFISSPVTTAVEGQLYEYQVHAIDPDGDPLTYSLAPFSSPENMIIDQNTGLIQWVPNNDQASVFSLGVHVLVSDGDLSEIQIYLISVQNVNQPPEIVSKPVTEVIEGDVYQYNVAARDIDVGDTLEYIVESGPSGMAAGITYGEVLWDTTNVDPGIYPVSIIARDSAGGIFRQTFDVNVLIDRDLVIEEIDKSQLLTDGQNLTVSGSVDVSVRNRGSHEVTQDCNLILFDDLNKNSSYDSEDTLIAETQINGPIAAGAQVSVTVPIPEEVPLIENILLGYIDSSGIVSENNEINNVSFCGHACESFPTPSNIDPVLEWSWTETANVPESVNVIMTPVVADINKDGHPDIIFISTDRSAFDGSGTGGILRAIDGVTGVEIFSVTDPQYRLRDTSELAVGDIDLDGYPEIIGTHVGRRLICFNHDGSFKWQTGLLEEGQSTFDPAIADLDRDGIPEIIASRFVYNNDGTQRWGQITGSRGGFLGISIPLVADIDVDGSPEVVTGNAAWSEEGILRGDWRHNTGGGLSAVANFDQDPEAEIVVVSFSNDITLVNFDSMQPVLWSSQIPGGGYGSPTIADLDNDGQPEVGVAGFQAYTVFDTDGSVLWSVPIKDLSSGMTGSSVFDFEGDGLPEILFSDEENFYIFRGFNGDILFQTPMSSGTLTEYPIVADVDADGNAEVVVPANNIGGFGDQSGIYVFGGRDDSWVATREIWNQHTYHVTNVNDDGSIPLQEQNSWELHNSYRTNAFNPREVDYSVYSSPDFTPLFVRSKEEANTITLKTRIANVGGIKVGAGVDISFFNGDPSTGGALLGSVQTSKRLIPGDFEDVQGTFIKDGLTEIWIAADYDSEGQQQHRECNEDNNFYIFEIQQDHSPYINTFPNLNAVVNQAYTYTVEAEDSDVGDDLTYELLSGPNGMTLNSTAGSITWLPGPEDLGVHLVRLKVTDQTGLFDLQRYEITVREVPLGNQPSQIISTPPSGPFYSLELYSYQVMAQDINGDVLTYELLESPIGMTIDSKTGKIEWIPVPLQKGDHTVTVSVSDPAGSAAVQQYTLTIIGNTPPQIISIPVTTAIEGLVYQYNVNAADADPDETFEFSLITAPAGMSIDVQSGIINWQPGSADIGSHPVTVQVKDSTDNTADQNYSLEVIKGNQSPRVGTIPDQSITGTQQFASINLDDYVFDPDHTDNQIQWTVSGQTELSVDIVNRVATITHPSGSPVSETLVFTATDPDGFFASTEATFSAADIVIVDVLRPEVTLSFLPGVDNPVGVDVSIQIQAVDDQGVTQQLIQVDGQELPLDANGQAVFTSQTPGIFTVEAFAYDAAGNEGYKQAQIRFLEDIGDTTVPTASIQSPAEDSRLVTPVDITGDAFDETDLLSFRLEYALQGSTNFALINSGTTEVSNGILGTLDPTLMKNGIYQVRLTAEDTSGNVTTVNKTYIIDGNAKVGNFTVSFEDITIPVAGIPITLVRTYDSREKTAGDFGFGWQLSSNDIQIQESRVLGSGWQQPLNHPPIPELPYYSLEETEPHYITVTYPDGQVDRFTMDVSPNISTAQPISQANVVFNPSEGTVTQLQSLAGNEVSVNFTGAGDEVELTGTGDVFPYNPDFYQLTTPNGETFDITQGEGIKRIQDRNGNILQFDSDAMVHSSGKFVELSRDGTGRITQITDPDGNTIVYEYDFYGDLVSVTDQKGNITQFRYDNKHNLMEIIDPRGIQAARNEYDNNGRLIATIDADGNRVEFNHDMANNQEVVIDREGGVTVYEYDAEGNVTKETNALGHINTFTYDDNDNQLTATDALGNTTTSTYDDGNNLLTQTDPLGNTTTYTYNAFSQILSMTDPLNNVTTYTYDGQGNLSTTSDPLNHTTTNTYDTNGNLLTTTDPLGNVTTYTYDDFGNVLTETNALGHLIVYAYDDNGNRLTETRTRTTSSGTEDLVTTFVYDADNRLIQTTDPAGNITRIEYNVIGKESARVDQKGRRTELYYDFRGNLIQTRFPDGTTEEMSYDKNGNETSRTDRSGNITTFEYDAANRQIKVIAPDGGETATVYDDAGRPISVTDPLGHATTYEYDDAGRNTKVIDALGNETQYAYDAAGRRISMTDALGHVTQMAYDAVGRLTQTTFDNGTTRTVTYDALGRQIEEIDQAGVTTQYEYDELGRLITVTDALGGETSYTYDELGNRLTQTDANNHTTHWEYDSLGSMVERELPLSMTEHFVYDATNNVTSHTDFNSQTIVYTYDDNDRLIRKTLPGSVITEWTYTPNGQRATAVDSRGTTVYTYDGQDRLLSVIQPDGSEISYTYDLAGNRTSVTIPSGTTTYLYDELNRLSRVTDPDGRITDYTYNAVGSRESVSVSDGIRATYTYDALNRLTYIEQRKFSGPVLNSYTYILGPTGNRLSVTEEFGRQVNYTYDTLYRLTEEAVTDPVNGNQTFQYTYDAVGNRLTKTDSVGTTNYTYDANDRLFTEGSNIYTYDDNGNTLSRSDNGVVTNYGYDPENRLDFVQGSGQIITYGYDEDGIRVNQSVNGVVTKYLVDKNLDYAQVLEERTGGGILLVRYVYGNDLISQNRTGNISHYHYDGLGSVRGLSRGNSFFTDEYNYDAFGELLNQIGVTQNNYLFTGEQYDPNIGFYYLRARYYMPQQGRFLTMDTWPGSVYDPPSLHKYLYTHADPVNNIDPSGNFTLNQVLTTINIIGTIASLASGAYSLYIGDYKGAALSFVTLGFFGIGGTKKVAGFTKWWLFNRGIRVIYKKSINQIINTVRIMRKNGKTIKEIAEEVVKLRNKAKIDARTLMRVEDVVQLEKRNLLKYGNAIGPTVEQLAKTMTYNEIINSAMRTNKLIDLFFLIF